MLWGLSILAAEHAASSPAGTDPLIPLSPAWITGFLLLVLWLFVAAILLGPLIRHFQLEPRSFQYFTGDRTPGPRRR